MEAAGCLMDWIPGSYRQYQLGPTLSLHLSSESVSTLSPIGRQPASQNMLTCAKCYWYELPEQFFYPTFHKTDISHKVHTQIFIQTHVIWKKKKQSEKSSNCKITVSVKSISLFQNEEFIQHATSWSPNSNWVAALNLKPESLSALRILP